MPSSKQITYLSKRKKIVDKIVDFVYSPRTDKFNDCPFQGIWENKEPQFKCREICERLFYRSKIRDNCPCYEYTNQQVTQVLNMVIIKSNPDFLRNQSIMVEDVDVY